MTTAPPSRTRPRPWAVLAVAVGVLAAGCTGGDDEPAPAPTASTRSTASAPPEPTAAAPTPEPTAGPTADVPDAVSLPAYFDPALDGGGLRLGAVRESTSERTSYDVSYRGDGLRISGVLEVPTGRGPFPAVVLAHGFIEPGVYVRGQGMTRERGYLAEAGYVALHVDYRNHAESDDDPAVGREFRLGYAVDVLNAVRALRRTEQVPVDDDRVALMGRSMGGGVVYQALEMAPGLVDAGVTFASVSTRQSDNLAQYGDGSGYWGYVQRRYGRPASDPSFWGGVSAIGYVDRITEPVLAHHGRLDVTCPPAWAARTHRALLAAGVDARLAWYDDEGHELGVRFEEAMARSVRFLDARLA